MLIFVNRLAKQALKVANIRCCFTVLESKSGFMPQELADMVHGFLRLSTHYAVAFQDEVSMEQYRSNNTAFCNAPRRLFVIQASKEV